MRAWIEGVRVDYGGGEILMRAENTLLRAIDMGVRSWMCIEVGVGGGLVQGQNSRQ